MRIVVTGASGNIGTSFIEACSHDDDIEIVGVARRRPDWQPAHVEWRTADIVHDDLDPIVRGADAVVHLAWSIQDRVPEVRDRTNLDGSARVFAAAAGAAVPLLVHMSSIGAYSPGPRDHGVDESWPTEGITGSTYSQHKAQVERMLDAIENDGAIARVVRVRPALVLKGDAATEIHDLFLGATLPRPLVPSGALVTRVVRRLPLALQVVHSLDVGEALRLVVRAAPTGAFNLAADPVLGGAPPPDLLLRGARAIATAAHGIGILPPEGGWVDMARAVPLLDPTRAQVELGWQPRHDALHTLAELLDGMRAGRTFPTPPLRAGGVDDAMRHDRVTARAPRVSA